MSGWVKVELPNGNQCGFTHCETVIPHDSIKGLTAEQIGLIVISFAERGMKWSDFINYNPGSFDSLEEFDQACIDSLVSKKKTTKQIEEKPRKPGFVYLMIDRRTGYYKIGWSTKPEYRERTLQAEQPAVELLHYWPGTFR